MMNANDSDYVVLEPMYKTSEGLEFIVNPDDHNAIQTQIEAGNFRLAFLFQAVDCACIYAVSNKDTWAIDIEVYKHLQKNPYTKQILFKLLVLGHFDIGISRLRSYHIIKEITSYWDPINSELNAHYIYPRSNPDNVGWRSVNWDLFETIVDEMNADADKNNLIANCRYDIIISNI
jgi:hypothetical protein